MARVTILESIPVNKNTIYNNLYKYLMDNNYTNMILIDLVPNSYNSRLFNITGNNRIIDVEHWYTDEYEFNSDEFLRYKGTMEEDEDPIAFNLNQEFLDSLYVVKLSHTGKWYLASADSDSNFSLIKFVPDSIAFKPVKLDNSSNKNLIKDCFDHNHYNTPRICNCSKLLNVSMKTRVDDIMLEYIDEYEVEPYTENYEETEENTELNYLGQFPADFLIDKIKEGAKQWGDEINMKLLESYKKQYNNNINKLNKAVEQFLSNPDQVSINTNSANMINPLNGTATQVYMQSKPNLQPTPVPKKLGNSFTSSHH